MSYNDFSELCRACWRRKYGFVVIDKESSEYNARKHRTIGARPIDVMPASSKRLLRKVYSNVKIAGSARFRVGNPVRVQQTLPATYLLEEYCGEPIAGGFYEHELHAVKHPDVYLVEKILRRRGNEVLVKWLGLNNSHNSWINKNNVVY
ncbi:uncharacterized protein LOC109861250 [Pseudomyrmex gracilis]|uniref:uncharacterized protein LOC109861250 n=1 Tax=Pseudomyrmex gracilis TaxID=219809 RepID=UPI00099571A2|nr:uncharacterized protein LOC109861250 [Pseudomyrmex gracilis]